jgi:iron-sulfur cluster repair protein YtfE (RIC family)
LHFEEDGPLGVSEIRNEITGQHAELRGLLDEIEVLAIRFEKSTKDDADLGRDLHERGRVLYEKFGAHMDREQALLEPVLRQSGREGERLANRLRNEHHEQRELLKYLMARLVQHPEPTILIARELQHFSGFLRYEMAHEEETLLSPSVLKDTGD